MKKYLLINLLVFCFILPASGQARDISSIQMMGVRMGFWSAVKAQDITNPPDQEITTKVTAPYGEIFISSGLKKGFALEFSLGSCYRGETRYSDSYGYYWKRVTIYPVSGGIKFYPLSSVQKSKLQPYADLGVAFVSGIEDIRLGIYSGPYLLVDEGINTYTTFGWHAGLGVDFPLNRFWAVGVDFKYRGVNFNDEVGGLKNFSGPQVTLGVSYLVKGI
ncbi:MAG: outer membrane beta-barrel protein [Candidatus Zixiibacteriota bacterium]